MTAPPATASPTAPSSAGRAWARLPNDPALEGAFIGSLDVAARDRLLAAGYVTQGEGKVEGAIWASDDGRSWRRLTGRPGFEDAAVNEITRAPDGTFLATGSTCYYECSGIRMWRSADGVTWTAVNHDLPDSSFVKLIAGGPGWIGVGEVDLPFGRLAAWTSPDGAKWKASSGLGTGQGVVRGVVRTTRGYVAAGSVYPEDRSEPAVWRSADGAAWTRVDAGSGPQGLGLDALAQLNGLLIGFVRTEAGIEVWTSENGQEWTNRAGASSPFTLGGSRAVRLAVVEAAGPGIVAVGVAESGESSQPLGVWLSADGITWEAADDIAAFDGTPEVYDAVGFGDEVFAVGRFPCDIETCVERPAIWVSPPR